MRVRVLLAAGLAVLSLASVPSASANDAKSPPEWRLTLVRAPSGDAIATGVAPKVDCVRATWCVLLTDPRFLTTLDGANATTTKAPVPGAAVGGYSALNSIACRAVGNCVADGTNSAGPWDPGTHFRDELHHGAWQLEDGGPASGQVACNRARCVETLTADAGIPQGNVADRAGNADWVDRAIVTPWQDASDHGFNVDVTAVTCAPGKASCYGVGTAAPDFRTVRPMFFFRAGDSWKGVQQALPAGADADNSTGVRELSCASEGNCAGLGTFTAAAGTEGVYAERFVDGVLSADVIPLPAYWQSASSRIAATGLACTAMDECAGYVANYFARSRTNRTVLVRLHAGSWTYHALPAPAHMTSGGSPYVSDVSCSTASSCVAVGSYPVGKLHRERYLDTYRAAAWVLADGRWTAWRVPVPAGIDVGSQSVRLGNVDCAPWYHCVLTGTAAGKAVFATMTLPR